MVDLLSDSIVGTVDGLFGIWSACLVFEMFSLVLKRVHSAFGMVRSNIKR